MIRSPLQGSSVCETGLRARQSRHSVTGSVATLSRTFWAGSARHRSRWSGGELTAIIDAGALFSP